MDIEQTPEGLTRLTVKMPEDTRNIYFYTENGVTQSLNPDVKDAGTSSRAESREHQSVNITKDGNHV